MVEKFCFYMYLTLYFCFKSNACLQEYFDTELIFNVSMQVRDIHHPTCSDAGFIIGWATLTRR